MAFCVPWNTNLLNIVMQRPLTTINNTIIMVGRSSVGNTLAKTGNLVTWTGNSTISIAGRAIAFNGASTYYVVGEGTNTMIRSVDGGVSWAAVTSPFSTSGRDIIYAGLQLIACGSGTNMLAYYTGSTWTSIVVDASNVNRLYHEPVLARTYAMCNGNTQLTYTTNITGTWKPFFKYAYLGEYNGMHGPATYLSGRRWIASGTSATTGLSYSTNGGTSWSAPSNIGLTVNSIAYGVTNIGSPLWVATGTSASYAFAYSSNGSNWTLLDKSVITIEGNGIAFGANRTGSSMWVAVGSGTNKFAYSYDGTTWTGVSNTIFSDFGTCVAFGSGNTGNNLFIAGGSGTVNSIAYSPDGVSWAGSGVTIFSTTYGIAYGTNNAGVPIWVIVGTGTTHTLAYGTNFNSWTGLNKTMFSNYGTCVEYGTDGAGNPLWVAGGSGATYTLAWSNNGSSWTGISNTVFTIPKNISYGINSAGNPVWIATGQGGSIFAISTNGTNWSTITPTVFTNNGLCSAQEKWPKYILCGINGFSTNKPDSMRGSIDGLTWFYIKSPFSLAAYDVCWSQQQQLWVAAGEGGNTLAYSSNGIQWTGLGTSIFSLRGNRVTFSATQSKWFAVGEGINTLATSTDGQIWTGVTSTTSYVDVSGISIYAS